MARTATDQQTRDGQGGASGPLETGQAFGPRYHIIRVLGVGGMGAVYQAWDAELGVAVAIKVIRPGDRRPIRIAAQEIERRFKRELLLARQVTHQNVVRIHDLGEIDGIKYITMPFVEGVGSGDDPQAARASCRFAARSRIARGIVSGLVAAHEAGVVHRDLKPANIMIDADDEPTIMDFGIARSSGRGRPAAPRGATLGPPIEPRSRRCWPARRWPAPSSAPSSTWRRSRPGASPSISAPTSTRSA